MKLVGREGGKEGGSKRGSERGRRGEGNESRWRERRTSSDGFLKRDSPAHELEVMEIERESLITLLAQASQLPVHTVSRDGGKQ